MNGNSNNPTIMLNFFPGDSSDTDGDYTVSDTTVDFRFRQIPWTIETIAGDADYEIQFMYYGNEQFSQDITLLFTTSTSVAGGFDTNDYDGGSNAP